MQRRDSEPRDSKRRCDTMLDFAWAGSYHGSTTEGQKQSQKDRGRRLYTEVCVCVCVCVCLCVCVCVYDVKGLVCLCCAVCV